MSERISWMPIEPCNGGCPRAEDDGVIINALGRLGRIITATPEGCSYAEECQARLIREGVGNYRGDQDYLAERYGRLATAAERAAYQHPQQPPTVGPGV